jgi:hypothetical protein
LVLAKKLPGRNNDKKEARFKLWRKRNVGADSQKHTEEHQKNLEGHAIKEQFLFTHITKLH